MSKNNNTNIPIFGRFVPGTSDPIVVEKEYVEGVNEHIESIANSSTASHVKLSDVIDNDFDSTQGIAATPKAIKTVLDIVNKLKDKDTTYTFESGSDGTFSVTPLGGNLYNISIGKPKTAEISDKVKNTINIAISNEHLISTIPQSFNGSSMVSIGFGEAAAKNISSKIDNNDNLITANAIYEALSWGYL